MAVDLIKSPNIPQTFIHDVESAFWVLLWIALSFMKSNWDKGTRSSFIKGTMSPKIFDNTGGLDKFHFMWDTSQMPLEIENNPTYTTFLIELKQLLGVRHRDPPKPPSVLNPRTTLVLLKNEDLNVGATPEHTELEFKTYNELREGLEDHDLVLYHFKRSLDELVWPTDDKAICQPLVPSTDVQTKMQSSTKRSVKIAGINGVYVSASDVKKSKSGPF